MLRVASAFLFGALCSIPSADADCVVRGRRVVVQHHPAVVVQQAAIVPVITQPLILPSYSVSYIGDSTSAIVAELQALRLEAQALRGELQASRKSAQAKQPATMPKADEPQVPGVFAARCSACHDASVAAKKGAGFAFLDKGVLLVLKAEQKLEILRRINLDGTKDAGAMPKGGPGLNDEEAAQVLDFLTRPVVTVKTK